MANQAKQLKKLEAHLDDDETVEMSIFGAYETKSMGSKTVRNGIFAATNKRLVFFGHRTFGFDLESFPYSNISSIELSKGMMGHKMKFFASGNEVAMKWINDKSAPEFVNYVKGLLGKKHDGGGTADPLDQLKKLAELKDKGVITDAEFAAKKKQLLGL